MCNMKNYWLDRIDRRKKDQDKQIRLNGIVDNVIRRIKTMKGKTKA